MNFIVNKGFILFLILGFFACSTPEKDAASRDQEAKENSSKGVVKNDFSNSNEDTVSQKEIPNFESELDFATFIATSIEQRDYSQWDQITEKEVLFSPYAYINTGNANSLSVEELNNPTNENKFWGIYDGRGDRILLSTQEYLKRFVYGVQLSGDSVQITVFDGHLTTRGNTLQTIQKTYPSSVYVKFFNPASSKNGMDWKALILVVSKNEDSYVLEAIIHNQWTV